MAQQLEEFEKKLPQKILSWQMTESEFYNRENLHHYINGGAELYLSYGFLNLYRRKYEASNEPAIFLDIFDMADSKNAFAVFSHSREQVESDIGQGSQYTQGLLLFWKNRFLISILCSPETNTTRKLVFDLARDIESLIPENGDLPSLLSFLPQTNLRQASIRYFYHYIWLNSHFFISNENILNIVSGTEAVLAKYNRDNQDYTLLLIQYPDEAQSKEAEKKFVIHYTDKTDTLKRFKDEEGLWTCWARKANYLAIVFKGRSEKEGTTLLTNVLNNLAEEINKGKSNE